VDNANDPYLHMLCTWALARMHPEDKPRQAAAVQHLVGKLGDKDREMAHVAARAIAELDPTPEVIRPAMEKVMAGADAETADRIFSAYASLGARIVPLALNALKDPAETRRERALRVLAKVGPEAAPAVPELIALIQGRNAKEKSEALFVPRLWRRSATATRRCNRRRLMRWARLDRRRPRTRKRCSSG
jgi:HEAT repeat protein